MLSKNYFLLTSLILIHFIQTSSYAKKQQQQSPSCYPSSCGNIHNISYPFRLKDDPPNFGDSRYQLACENNTTFVYIDSHRYHVQEINYHNYTIRLTDPAIQNNDTCSFPMYSLNSYNFTYSNYPYSINSYTEEQTVWPITFMSCPFPVNDSIFTETDHCVDINYDFNASNRIRHTHIKVGMLNTSDIRDMCRIDVVVMTSFPFKHENNISLLQIHHSLLYGFELSWYRVFCARKCYYCLFDGNRAVCGYPSHRPWFCRFPDGPCGIKELFITVGDGMGVFLKYVVEIYFALRFSLGMTFLLGLIIYKHRRRHLSMFDLIESFLQSQNNLMPIRYSYSHIKKMTRGFREKLGQGGYGSVYRGKLRSGSTVAVKVLTKPSGNGQDFINEVATIGRIHHVNVVKLIGYCAERSKCALVYGFMPNGSLEKYIFSRQEREHNLLSWDMKYGIAVGVACGIEYLHRGCDIQILHFDIKPHNILLDENFTPKISDFGLAKFYSTEKNIVTLTAARGTIWYVAPELINKSIGGVSYKADVYSFGMLLMEMVGIKKNLASNDHSSSQYFPDWIYDSLNNGKDIVIGNVDDDCERKMRRRMTIVALWCIQMNPSDRPSMSKVLEMLESETEVVEIPLQNFQSAQVTTGNEDQTWGTDSTDSIALLVAA